MPVDPALARALAAGTYVVDARAVADAIMRRGHERDDARRLLLVLEAAKRDGRAGGVPQHEPGADPDLA